MVTADWLAVEHCCVSPHHVGLLISLILYRQHICCDFMSMMALSCWGDIILQHSSLTSDPSCFYFIFLFFTTEQIFSGNQKKPRLMLFSLDIVSFWVKKNLLLLSYKNLPQKGGEITPQREGRWNNYRYIVFPRVSVSWTLWCWKNASFWFDIYLNAEGSELQIQLDLFSLWILSPAVITSLLNSKGEKEIQNTSNKACLTSSVNESENRALTFTWNR